MGGDTGGSIRTPTQTDKLFGCAPGGEEDPQPLHFTVEGASGGEVEASVGAGPGETPSSLRHIHHPHCWTLGLPGRMAGWSGGSWLTNSANNIIT